MPGISISLQFFFYWHKSLPNKTEAAMTIRESSASAALTVNAPKSATCKENQPDSNLPIPDRRSLHPAI